MKKATKRLNLHRETLRNLEETPLRAVAAGVTSMGTCATQCAQTTHCITCATC
jgi:hypothetical protein